MTARERSEKMWAQCKQSLGRSCGINREAPPEGLWVGFLFFGDPWEMFSGLQACLVLPAFSLQGWLCMFMAVLELGMLPGAPVCTRTQTRCNWDRAGR